MSNQRLDLKRIMSLKTWNGIGKIVQVQSGAAYLDTNENKDYKLYQHASQKYC